MTVVSFVCLFVCLSNAAISSSVLKPPSSSLFVYMWCSLSYLTFYIQISQYLQNGKRVWETDMMASVWKSPENPCLSINALRACVYIYIRQLSSFRAPTFCCLSIWMSYLPYSLRFSEFMPISFTRKRTKHENTRSPPFSYHTKRAADVNTGAQSINTESLFNCTLVLSRLNRDCLCPVLSRMRFPRELRCLACNSINNDSVVTQVVRVRPLVAVQASDLPFYAFARLFVCLLFFFLGGGGRG